MNRKGKCAVGEISARGNVQLEKRPVGEIAARENIWSGKCQVGEVSVGEFSSRGCVSRGSVGRVNVQSGKCPDSLGNSMLNYQGHATFTS